MPSGRDLQEAVQNPQLNFADPELKQGRPVLNDLGLPKPISGNFSSVFTLECPGGKRYAVKCFFHDYEDLHARYDAIHGYLKAVQHPWEVDFAYVPSGVRVAGRWHPVVKMQWFEGVRLDRYVQAHLGQPKVIMDIAKKFVATVQTLSESGAAHGDLQHGNILVNENGDLRLVDYDGMYVPALAGRKSHEVGHPNYQHPGRTRDDFGPYLDNFSAWVIYVSLLATAVDPSVWIRVQGGDDALVFKRQDFDSGIFSAGFGAVEASGNESLKELATQLRGMVQVDITRVPRLTPIEIEMPDSFGVPAPAFSTSPVVRMGSVPTVPEWMGGALPAEPVEGGPAGIEWMIGQLGQLPPVEVRFHVAVSRAILAVAGGLIGAVILGVATGFLVVEALLAVVATVAFASVALWIAYRRTPETQDKRRTLRELAAQRKSTRKAGSIVDGLAKRRLKNDQDERKKTMEIQRRQDKQIEEEQKALHAAEQRMQSRLRKLAESRAGLTTAEQKEQAEALRQFQQGFVRTQLAGYPISGASIRGIGPTLTLNLAVYGIETAADFVDWGYDGNTVYLVNSNGRRVHVPGIGEQRTLSLVVWQNGVEGHVRAAAPQALPQIQSQQIQQKFAAKVTEIGVEEGQARRVAQQEADQIRGASQQKQGELRDELQSARTAAMQLRTELDQQLSHARGEHNAKQWALAKKDRDAKSYSEVTFGRSLATTVRATGP